jgi:hypothetical protein
MDVVLLSRLYFSSSIVDLRERIEGLEILDVRGHEIDWRDLLVLRECERWKVAEERVNREKAYGCERRGEREGWGG